MKKQLINEVEQFKKIAGILKENRHTDDTDAVDGIDEAGNIKGIKIEIPGNSYASDFGKAVAKELIESFGPREMRNFLQAFTEEFHKLTT